MKKAYVTPEVVVHGTVEDITQVSDMLDIVNGPRVCRGRKKKCNPDPPNYTAS